MITALIRYQAQWYRVVEHERSGKFTANMMQFFDMVVDVNNGKYTVLKNRDTGIAGNTGSIALLQMQLFVGGETLDDLPLFVNKAECKRDAYALRIKESEGGDLIVRPLYR